MTNKEEMITVAQRGRYNEDGKAVQKLELGNDEYFNAITTVQKDGMIMEKTNKRYRIRKITARESWRLMGIRDEDFEKAEEVNSSTQLYREAGNGICVNVLMAIFSQLGLPGVPRWNDISNKEKYVLLDRTI